MATFFTDADVAGAGEFVEPEVLVGTEFTIPDATVTPRWHWPNVAPTVTPQAWIYNAAGVLQNAGSPLPFLTSTLGAWNSCSSISLSAGTYRVTVNTNRYPAVVGFFSGGPVTRGSVTAVQGRFGATGSAPASTSTAAYLVDWDVVPSGAASAAPNGIAVPVVLGQPAVALSRSAAPAGLVVAVSLGTPAVGRNGAAPNGLAAAVALGVPAVALNRAAAPSGLAVATALGQPSTNAPGRAVTTRPFTGTTARPNSGITPRP